MAEVDKTTYLTPDDWLKQIETHRIPDSPNYEICGQIFDFNEIALAADVYCQWYCEGIFTYSKVELAEFLNYDWVLQHMGAKIVLGLLLHPDVIGAFLLGEDDARIVQMSRKRLQNEEHGLEWDSKLEIAYQ